jgi:hypothetical protein
MRYALVRDVSTPVVFFVSIFISIPSPTTAELYPLAIPILHYLFRHRYHDKSGANSHRANSIMESLGAPRRHYAGGGRRNPDRRVWGSWCAHTRRTPETTVELTDVSVTMRSSWTPSLSLGGVTSQDALAFARQLLLRGRRPRHARRALI